MVVGFSAMDLTILIFSRSTLEYSDEIYLACASRVLSA
jgi:hypothetical protein